ncbi:MAG: helix-turn-helix domain-containing protein [Clostridia bacterium]|jgi:transcriptional regulator with XRE-family HTH domain|nr:helix-turn-helix domain-containing protein [Clostridia bacterium]MCI1999006.1 helix-turn-helix domain-containing protein [Clostridia bacterium]MCI2013756.1 helix-turn-helix domain-containing protein [Clostridia bacterium]
MDNRIEFSKRLKELREELGMTQKAFSSSVQSTPATISAYENATKNPSLDIIMNISKKYNVSLDWLCGLSNEKNVSKKIVTYSDVVRILILLESNPELEFYIGIQRYDEYSHDSFIDYSGITFQNQTMEKILKDWDKMNTSLKEEIIDSDIYDLWIEKTLKKYNFKITKDKKEETDPKPSEDINPNSDDLPF